MEDARAVRPYRHTNIRDEYQYPSGASVSAIIDLEIAAGYEVSVHVNEQAVGGAGENGIG